MLTFTNVNVYVLIMISTVESNGSGGAFMFFVLTSTMIYDEVREGRAETQVRTAYDSRKTSPPFLVNRSNSCGNSSGPVDQWILNGNSCGDDLAIKVWHEGRNNFSAL